MTRHFKHTRVGKLKVRNMRRRMMGLQNKILIKNIPWGSFRRKLGLTEVYFNYYDITFPYPVTSDVSITVKYKRAGNTYISNKTETISAGSNSISILLSTGSRPSAYEISKISPAEDDTYIYWE